MDIATVSMVNFHDESESFNKSDALCPTDTFFLRTFLDGIDEKRTYSEKKRYNWLSTEQSTVLSGLYWLNYISILPAGMLSQKYGSKRVVGYSQGFASVMSLLIPFVADYGYLPVAWLRAIQGILSFMSVPAGMMTIVGNWSSNHDRGMFMTALIIGSCFGYALSNFCFGYIAKHISWQYIFHATSACGLIWSIFWYLFVYDDPNEHPTISLEEKNQIQNGVKKSTLPLKKSFPWTKAITNIPVIVCVLAINGAMRHFVMMATYAPLYLKSVHGLNIQEIGIITSFSPLLSCVITFVAGYYSDLFIKRGTSLNTSRNFWTLVGCVISAVPLLVIAFADCNINLVLLSILLCFCLKGCSIFGPFPAIIDMSPKFCGVLDGIAGTATSVQTFLYTSMVNYMRGVLSTEDFWKFVFVFIALFVILTNLLFIIFGSCEAQDWNFDKDDEKK